MPSKSDVQKRRVQAQKATAAREAAQSRRERKRRLVIGGVAGFLAVMMVVSLGSVALLASDDGPSDPADVADSLDLEPLPDFVELTAPDPGEALTGATPCPADDGSSPRTTSFEELPPLCINLESLYELTVTTDFGDVVVTVDPSLDADAANLFITAARYHAYDGNPFWFVSDGGLVVASALTTESVQRTDGSPDLGVGLAADPPASAAAYQPATVAMLVDLDGLISSSFVLVTNETGTAELALEPVHPVVGTITGGLDVAQRIVNEAGSPVLSPVADIRIHSITVAELAG